MTEVTSESCDEIAKTLEAKYLLIAEYEANYEHAKKILIRAKAAATQRTDGSPAIVKLLIENDAQVVDASDKESEAYKILQLGQAEIAGLEAKFQAAKHLLQLKIQELRCFRG